MSLKEVHVLSLPEDDRTKEIYLTLGQPNSNKPFWQIEVLDSSNSVFSYRVRLVLTSAEWRRDWNDKGEQET